MITVLVLLAMITVAYVIVQQQSAKGSNSVDASVWEAAVANEKSEVGRILLRVARPVANIPSIYDQAKSPQYKALHAKILASGSYGGSMEIFLGVQAIAAFVAVCGLVAGIVSGIGGLALAALLLGALAVAALPYNTVQKKAKKREDAVADELPVFAELLLMPLESGMTPMSALAFTAERLEGPVAQEVQNLRTVINSRAMSEPQAFQLAASRLGTPEASAFFTALMQAHLEGAKVIRNLKAQAEALRVTAFQRQRGELKKLPVKLVLIFAVHLLPLLFVAALLPTFFSLSQI